MKHITFFYTLTMFVLASCCTSSKTMTSTENNTTAIYEKKWLLKKIYTEEGVREVNTKAFIRFNKEKNTAGGNGSCNTFGSTTSINGNVVSFKNIFSTKMYCADVQNIEDVFLRQLGKVNRFEVEGKKLFLYLHNEKLLEFESE